MKRFISIMLMLAMAICVFAGCGTSDTSTSTNTATRTFTDGVGRTVEIPSTIEKIVALGNAPRMITYLGLADKAVGIGGMDPASVTPVTAYAYANKELWANVPIVGTDAAGATDYYPEEIIRVDPDIILCTYTAELADEIQTKTGTPVVAVTYGTLFGEDFNNSLRLLADACGATDRAEEVISYTNNCLADLKARTENIPDADKPTVLGAAATFKGMHGIDGVYTNYAVFKAIAANDVTTGLSSTMGALLVDKEQIIGWNPMYICLDSGGVGIVKADYAENADFYAHLTAVQNGNLYQYPSSTSYYSNNEIPIVNCYYVASLLYPEQFKDIDFEQKANEIFEFFLGDGDYLSKLEAAGAGYSKVTLGDN
jgi:iron complex transport system substrate-binding protein